MPSGTIGVSLLTLVPGRVGGTETYARALTAALARAGELEYSVLLPRIAGDAAGRLPARVASGYAASYSTAGRVAAMSRAAILPGRLRRELDLERLAAIHYPLTVALPLGRRDRPRAIVTAHDLIHRVHPELVPPHERAYRALAYERSIRRGARVVAVAHHLAASLVERLGLAEDIVRVVHPAVDHARFAPADRAREPLLLYPANAWPHKNHARLLEAFAAVRREQPELRLALAGQGHERRSVPEGVDVLGQVPHGRLADLYQRAAAVVFPSLHESFPQPPLEAMACGCPVVCSRIPGLEEVCGEAARYVDPHSADDIAQGILDALDGPDAFAAAGLERARRFTWDASARAQDAVYRELLEP